MYADECPPRAAKPQSYCATLLYSFFYFLLWLYHHVRKPCLALLTLFKTSRTTLLKPHITQQKHPHLQNHLAISGAISLHIEHLAQLLAFLVDAGTKHITLYDHLRPINSTHLASFMCQHNLHSFRISEIGLKETSTRYSNCQPHQSSRQCCLTEEKPHHLPEIHLTVVKPGAGRAAIARSARILAERQTRHSPQVTPERVMEWLDQDEANCMLPSEPDTVVVFPSPGRRSIPVLNEFPVWQLRLTQIRFSARPITDISSEEFSEMASSAASAPKRFGR